MCEKERFWALVCSKSFRFLHLLKSGVSAPITSTSTIKETKIPGDPPQTDVVDFAGGELTGAGGALEVAAGVEAVAAGVLIASAGATAAGVVGGSFRVRADGRAWATAAAAGVATTVSAGAATGAAAA